VLAREYDVKVENVIAGSGSEGIMSNIIRAFLGDEDEVLTTEAAFIGFQVLAKSRGVKYRTVPYKNWHYDLPALAESCGLANAPAAVTSPSAAAICASAINRSNPRSRKIRTASSIVSNGGSAATASAATKCTHGF